jgi:hypothetical protein
MRSSVYLHSIAGVAALHSDGAPREQECGQPHRVGRARSGGERAQRRRGGMLAEPAVRRGGGRVGARAAAEESAARAAAERRGFLGFARCVILANQLERLSERCAPAATRAQAREARWSDEKAGGVLCSGERHLRVEGLAGGDQACSDQSGTAIREPGRHERRRVHWHAVELAELVIRW